MFGSLHKLDAIGWTGKKFKVVCSNFVCQINVNYFHEYTALPLKIDSESD